MSVGGINGNATVSAAMDPLHFWSPQNIEKFLLIEPKYSSDWPSPYGPFHTQRETQELQKKFYKEINLKMNAMKKKLYNDANQQYLESKQSKNKKQVMTYSNLKDMKEQIEFDLAWLTFDEVNKFNDT